MPQRDQISASVAQSWLQFEPQKEPDPNTEPTQKRATHKQPAQPCFRANWSYLLINRSPFQTSLRVSYREYISYVRPSFGGAITMAGLGMVVFLQMEMEGCWIFVVVEVVVLLVPYYYYGLVALLSLLLYHFLSFSLPLFSLPCSNQSTHNHHYFSLSFFIPREKETQGLMRRR